MLWHLAKYHDGLRIVEKKELCLNERVRFSKERYEKSMKTS